MSVDLTEKREARLPRLARFSKDARAVGLARFRRRARGLSFQAVAILRWREDARSLSPAAWAFVAGLLWLAIDLGRLGWFAPPSLDVLPSLVFFTSLVPFTSLVLFVCLCVAALIDARYFVLPDGPLAILAVTGVAMRLTEPVDETLGYLAAAAFAFLVFRAIAWIFEKIRGFPGLGQGDARLFALAGLWLGWAGLPATRSLSARTSLWACGLSGPSDR
jgi:leader peptidase (prepilin peptidase)/N-methyltransferase